MNKRNLMPVGFILVCALQLAVPAWMIVEREWTLRTGQVFKFRTRPVDPVDAFRGRYVALGLEPETVTVADSKEWRYGQKAFAVLDTGADGFVVVTRLEHARPSGGVMALPVRITWTENGSGKTHITWPGLDRYYMAEEKAPAAEAAYRERSRRGNQVCHITVRVRGATGVIENLYVEDKPIGDWLRNHPH